RKPKVRNPRSTQFTTRADFKKQRKTRRCAAPFPDPSCAMVRLRTRASAKRVPLAAGKFFRSSTAANGNLRPAVKFAGEMYREGTGGSCDPARKKCSSGPPELLA